MSTEVTVLMVTSRALDEFGNEKVTLESRGLLQAFAYANTAEDVKKAIETWNPRALLISTAHDGIVVCCSSRPRFALLALH